MYSIPEWKHVKPWLQRVNPWLLLAPVASVLGIIGANALGWDWLLSKYLHETAAIGLMCISLFIFALRLKLGHGPLYPILVFLTASLLFREIHLDYTGDAIYVCLVITLIWVIRWRERISPQLREGPVFPWLMATLFTYFISQAIARRFFRIIPGEELLHVPLEEATETAGHIMLIVTSCAGAWARWQTKPDEKRS